jgi:hypothetical protein
MRHIKLISKHETKDKKCYTENEIISMLDFLTHKISVISRVRSAHFFNKFHRHPYGNEAFNLTFRYTDDDDPNVANWIPFIYHQRI